MRRDADDLDFLVDSWTQAMKVQDHQVIASGLCP